MRFNIMTLFPTEVDSFLQSSIIGRARKSDHIEVKCYNIRDYALDKHHRVDDTAYGGGQGMLMRAEPICRCCEQIKAENADTHIIYMSPKGRPLTQELAKKMLKYSSLTILCGHYEGIDQRILDILDAEEISIGDYILTGGELPAMVLVDTVARMVEGVLSSPKCFEDESLYSGLLEYPQYTKPAVFRGYEVPKVLQNGHHANIQKWKHEQSLAITKERRKDLYRAYMRKQTKLGTK